MIGLYLCSKSDGRGHFRFQQLLLGEFVSVVGSDLETPLVPKTIVMHSSHDEMPEAHENILLELHVELSEGETESS